MINLRILHQEPYLNIFGFPFDKIMSKQVSGLKPGQSILKRVFDMFGAFVGLLLTGWIILMAFLAASIDTRANGFFTQKRVGRKGKFFLVIKIRTMRLLNGLNTTVTTACDQRVTQLGRFWRRSKIDELPQLINILLGHMSFVGPRPDVTGFADSLIGKDRVILTVRPGITGPATLKYRNEEMLLSKVDAPERHNMEVVFPDKVRINRVYVQNWTFWRDLYYIWRTLI